jgi:hypothetical protein
MYLSAKQSCLPKLKEAYFMMLEEANERLKKKINVSQLEKTMVLYSLLDLSKDDFCKIIDAVGVDTLIEKQFYYERLRDADNAFIAKQRYIRAKQRLYQISSEQKDLEAQVKAYEDNEFQFIDDARKELD